MGLDIEGRISSGVATLDTGITDMVVLPTAEGWTLFTTSGRNGGLAGYSLPTNGTPVLVDTVQFSASWAKFASGDIALAESPGGGYELLVGARTTTKLAAYAVTEDGEIGWLYNYEGFPASFDRVATAAVGDDGVLLVDRDGQAGFAVRSPTTGDITSFQKIEDTSTSHAAFVTVATHVSIGSKEIYIVGDAGEDGITSYVRSGSSLSVVDDEGPRTGGGIMNPTDMAVVETAGSRFVITASAEGNNGALTVCKLTSTGALIRTDTINDSLFTRFGGVTKIATADIDGRIYVAAIGGADDGVSLFVLLPTGRLQFIAAQENTWTDGSDGQVALGDPTAIAMTAGGGKLVLFIAGEDTPGVSTLSFDISSIGETHLLANSGATRTGTSGDDVLEGQDGNDTIYGGAGDDIIADGAGTDRLSGGDGRDLFVLSGDDDTDTITDFEKGKDRLDLASWPFFYDPASLTINSTSNGADVVWRGTKLVIRSKDGETLSAGAIRTAILAGPSRAMDLSGYDFPEWVGPFEEPLPSSIYDVWDSIGNDLLTGGSNGDWIRIGRGNDEVQAGGGNDKVEGGFGTNLVYLGSGNDTYDDLGESETGDGDTIYGGSGNDTIRAGKGYDTIDGGSGRDLIYAGAGHDTVTGGTGADEAWLGSGNDTYSDTDLENASDNDVVYGESGHDRITGGNGDDQLDGGSGNDWLDGRDGADILIGGSGNDHAYGRDGADDIRTGLHEDLIWAGSGDDRVDAGWGYDLVHGDGGDDWIHGEAGYDVIHGGTGDDYIRGGMGRDTIYGGSGNDKLFGNAMSDVISGGSGNDEIRGGDDNDELRGDDGDDWITGHPGDDTLFGGKGADRLFGDSGNDTMYGGAGNDEMIGGTGDDTLNGNAGADRLFGFSHADTLSGGFGDDILSGGNGNDILRGGAGNDKNWGGHGADRFVFTRSDGKDKVMDYTGNDTIALEGLTAKDVTIATNNGNTFIQWDRGWVMLHDYLDPGFGKDDIDFV